MYIEVNEINFSNWSKSYDREEEEQELDEDDKDDYDENFVDSRGIAGVVVEAEISGDEEDDSTQTEVKVRSFHLLRTSASLIKNEFTIL